MFSLLLQLAPLFIELVTSLFLRVQLRRAVVLRGRVYVCFSVLTLSMQELGTPLSPGEVRTLSWRMSERAEPSRAPTDCLYSEHREYAS